MKLLLTSAGITNDSIAKSLQKLLNKPPLECRVGFIPTAANVEEGNKDWFINQFTNLQKYGFNWIDIIDISAPLIDWKRRLEEVDVIFVSGGNTFYLLDQIRKTGFDLWLKENIEKKVYVGASAGTIVTTPTIGVSSSAPADPNISEIKNLEGLKLVDFEISPHVPEHVSYKENEKYVKKSAINCMLSTIIQLLKSPMIKLR